MIAEFATDVLDRIVKPDDPALSMDVARHFLSLKFSDAERDRFNQLSEKARDGALTGQEAAELDFYLLVSHFVAALQSKARLSLKTHTSAA